MDNDTLYTETDQSRTKRIKKSNDKSCDLLCGAVSQQRVSNDIMLLINDLNNDDCLINDDNTHEETYLAARSYYEIDKVLEWLLSEEISCSSVLDKNLIFNNVKKQELFVYNAISYERYTQTDECSIAAKECLCWYYKSEEANASPNRKDLIIQISRMEDIRHPSCFLFKNQPIRDKWFDISYKKDLSLKIKLVKNMGRGRFGHTIKAVVASDTENKSLPVLFKIDYNKSSVIWEAFIHTKVILSLSLYRLNILSLIILYYISTDSI